MMKYKIILVENDEDEQVFMKDGFKAADLFEIVAILKNGDALFEWLEDPSNPLPDVILSDLNMPGKNGFDVISEVKANPAYSHIPVIITSTSSARSMIDKCLSQGAADYVVKPDTFIQYEPYVRRLHSIIHDKQLVKRQPDKRKSRK